jgi:23S rRNA pseudouridine1911/1915/1917 synthase
MSEWLNIIHEDDSLLIVNKPAGLVCHPTKGDAYSSLISRLRLYLGPEKPIHLINRLDRETSGLVIAAKTDEAASALRRRWERGEVQKAYLAIVVGSVAEAAGSIEAPIGPDPTSAVAIKSRICPGGAPSRTDFRVICRWRRSGCDYSVLFVSPRTGRKHQIRVHLAHIGHPVVGDKIYGPDEQIYLAFVEGRMTAEQVALMKLPNQALHAWSVAWDEGRVPWAYCAEPEEVFMEFMGQAAAEFGPAWEEKEYPLEGPDGVSRYSDARLLDLFKSFSKKKLTLKGALGIFAPHTEPKHTTHK